MQRVLWNPWHGCHKCSEGCRNCYVFYLDSKRDKDTNVITKSKTNFNLPLKKTKEKLYKIKAGTQVATCFTSDFFLEEADPWREEAWQIIKQRPDLNFVIATKRIARAKDCLPKDWFDGYKNVTIAVSCENQKAVNERLPYLIDLPVKNKWVFVAPILEEVDLTKFLKTKQIEEISVGGESYKNARECNFSWIESLYNQCKKFNVKFDFHQTGSNFTIQNKNYKIKHYQEYEQAKKGKELLRKTFK